MTAWKKEKFHIGTDDGLMSVDGYTRNGLGLDMRYHGYPERGKMVPAVYVVTHLNTGHSIAFLYGDIENATAAASQISELMDWTFSGLDGWKNMEPDLLKKLSKIIDAAGGTKHDPKHPGVHLHSYETAQAVLATRPG